MAIFKFEKDDLVRNSIKTHPNQSFYVYDSTIYESEQFPSSSLPTYGILHKDGTLTSYKTISQESFSTDFTYGDKLFGNDMSFFSSSLTRYYHAQDSSRERISSTLRNTLEHYKVWSPHYAYSSSLGDKGTQELSMINVPSLYYGSKIKKGSVSLKYYYTGTLAAELRDVYSNGTLVQVGPEGSNGSGSVAGICLYNEGILLLTGSWSITDDDNFGLYGSGVENGKWIHFGTGIEPDFPENTCTSSSFELNFQGTSVIPTITMFCSAPKGMLNNSSNPTFIEYGQDVRSTYNNKGFLEPNKLLIKNVQKYPYNDVTGSFEKVTYISKIHVYDKDKNLLGIAKLAKPIKKTQDREFTFKIKVDF